jgi:hypothetical protein
MSRYFTGDSRCHVLRRREKGGRRGRRRRRRSEGGRTRGPAEPDRPVTQTRTNAMTQDATSCPVNSRCHFLRRREEGLAAIIAGTVAASRPRQPAKGAPAIQMAMPGRSEQRGGAIVHGSSFLLSMYDLQSTSSFSIEKQQIKRPQHKLPVSPHKKNETETATATTQQQSKKVFLNIELACAVA